MAAVLSLALDSPTFADDDTGFYLGASVNRLSPDQDNVNDVDFDDSDNAFGLKAGYMLTDLLGIEGGYSDLGNYNTEGNEAGINLMLGHRRILFSRDSELFFCGKLGYLRQARSFCI